jgi:hypothetical protein
MDIYFVRGGDKTAPGIAQASGMLYGTRNDYKAYAPPRMLDIQWKKYVWTRYLARADEYRPPLAMVADYEHPDQKELLYRQIHDLERLHIERIMMCPKFNGAIADFPAWAVIAVSVPSVYAGFLPDTRELKGREVHLLGGKPEKQADILRKVSGAGGKVISVDGSYHAMKAGHGQWMDGGKWVQLRRHQDSSEELAIASGLNLVRYLECAMKEAQPKLF